MPSYIEIPSEKLTKNLRFSLRLVDLKKPEGVTDRVWSLAMGGLRHKSMGDSNARHVTFVGDYVLASFSIDNREASPHRPHLGKESNAAIQQAIQAMGLSLFYKTDDSFYKVEVNVPFKQVYIQPDKLWDIFEPLSERARTAYAQGKLTAGGKKLTPELQTAADEVQRRLREDPSYLDELTESFKRHDLRRTQNPGEPGGRK